MIIIVFFFFHLKVFTAGGHVLPSGRAVNAATRSAVAGHKAQLQIH